MQKLLHKIFVTLIFTVSFAIMPQVALSQVETQEATEIVTQAEQVNAEDAQNNIDELNQEMGLGEQKAIIIEDIEASANDNDVLTKNVVPDTFVELKKMVKMFLKVMLGVLVSTIIIFFLLLFVKRFYAPQVTLNSLNQDDTNNDGLDTPTNKNDALKTFLDKTKNN